MMSAINAKSDKKSDGVTKAIKATLDALTGKLNSKRKDYGFTSHQSLFDMLEVIKEKHPRIKEFLGSGEGILLMRMDSDIAIEVIKQHIEKNVPILSIHDSFVVPMWFEHYTRDIMNQAYGKMVSKYLNLEYKSTIETIHYAHGVIQSEDTSNNLNVSGLIKPAFKEGELMDAHSRLDRRVTSKQIRRQLKWGKSSYQIAKVARYEVYHNNTLTEGNIDCAEEVNF